MSRQVVDDIGAVQQRRQVGLHEVDLFEMELCMAASRLQVSLLAGPIVIIAEAIDPDDLISGGQQAIAQMGSDEPGGPRDNDPQQLTVPAIAVKD
jgi:hypothetical protein